MGALIVVATEAVGGAVVVSSYVIYRVAQTATNLLGTVLSEPPPNPPQVPNFIETITQAEFIQLTREKLGMDLIKQYYFCKFIIRCI